MRLSAHDDYGIRLLLRIARGEADVCMTTAVLAEREGMSMSHVGKVLRLLREGGFVESTRGNCGGYKLACAPEELVIGEVLAALGGRLFEDGYEATAPDELLCTGSVDCGARALWQMVQFRLDGLLANLTLADLMVDGERGVVTLGGKVERGLSSPPKTAA